MKKPSSSRENDNDVKKEAIKAKKEMQIAIYDMIKDLKPVLEQAVKAWIEKQRIVESPKIMLSSLTFTLITLSIIIASGILTIKF